MEKDGFEFGACESVMEDQTKETPTRKLH